MFTVSCIEEGGFSKDKAEHIFNNFIPDELCEKAYKYGLWLAGDPELDELEMFKNIQRVFSDWPYELKAYGCKFIEDIFRLTESLGYDEAHTNYNAAWFNLLRSLAFVTSNRVDENFF